MLFQLAVRPGLDLPFFLDLKVYATNCERSSFSSFFSLSVQEKGKFTTKEKNSRSKSALFIFPFFNIDPTNQEAFSVENIFPFYKYCQILEKYEIMGDYYAEAGKCIEKVLAKKV